jgi:hypothetical protein
MFLDCLDLQFEFGQIGFQFGDLLGFSLVTALKIIPTSAAVAISRAAAITISVPTITIFVRHFNSLNDIV